MDFYFENVGKPNARAITEMRYRIGAKHIWIISFVYVLLGVYFLREYLLGYSYLITSMIFFGGVIYFVLLPYLQVRKVWKKDLKFHNGTMPVNIVRFGENIRIENVTASRTWEYHHLTKVNSFKYSYCLRFSDKTVLLLDRANFTKGTFAEFKQFLRTKRPDLKFPE